MQSRNRKSVKEKSKTRLEAGDFSEIKVENDDIEPSIVDDDFNNVSESKEQKASPDDNKGDMKAGLISFASKAVSLVIALSMLYVFVSISTIEDFNIYVNGDFIEDQQSQYHKLARENMDDGFLGSWKLFYDVENLQNKLSTPLILVSNVSRDARIVNNTVTLNISESRPSIVYDLPFSSSKYLVDSRGVAYQKLKDQQSVPGSVTIIDETPNPVKLNSTAISVFTLEFINKLNGLLQRSEDTALTPVSYRINSSERLLELEVSEKDFFIKVATERPAESQYQALLDLLEFLDENNRDEPLQYLDVRLDGQVAYK